MPKTIIDEIVYNNAKKALLKLKSYGTTANKLKAVISAYDNGIKKVSEVFDVHPTSIHRWAKQVSDNDLDLLINDSKHQDGIKLKKFHKEEIRKWLNKDSNISILWVKERLEKQFDLKVSRSTVHRAMKSVGFSYITPRKNHYKQDKKEAEDFKKNLQDEIKEDEESWFFDESRFGTHSKIGHGWFRTGIRTPIKIKLGYKNFYLYSAANPKTGDQFTLLLPNVNINCMNIFLKEFAAINKNKKIAIVMDGAGWHKSDKLNIPENMRIIIQPPYSPELNPIEKLWQYIKNHTIKNKIFTTLKELENKVCKFVKTLTPEIIRSVCSINYI